MFASFYEKYYFVYSFIGICGLGLFFRLITNLVYKNIIKETDNIGNTKNKYLKHLKLKFETCYKLKIGVHNVDTFVDKNLLRYRFSGILLSTWENLCGQVLFLNLLIVPIYAVFGVYYECGQDLILLTGSVGIVSAAALIIVDKSINLSIKKRRIQLNLLDYLENFMKIRLEQENLHPEQLEAYRNEYFVVASGGKKKEKHKEGPLQADPKDELNRRREVKKKKEEEKLLHLKKREDEARRLEVARVEEEKRKLEERKQLVSKRREEEILKLEEERQALEARRSELKKKAEDRRKENQELQLEQLHKEGLTIESKSTEDAILSVEEDRVIDLDYGKQSASEREGVEYLIKAMNEIAAERERASEEEENDNKSANVLSKRNIAKDLTEQETKLIEDVLKEFFS